MCFILPGRLELARPHVSAVTRLPASFAFVLFVSLLKLERDSVVTNNGQDIMQFLL